MHYLPRILVPEMRQGDRKCLNPKIRLIPDSSACLQVPTKWAFHSTIYTAINVKQFHLETHAVSYFISETWNFTDWKSKHRNVGSACMIITAILAMNCEYTCPTFLTAKALHWPDGEDWASYWTCAAVCPKLTAFRSHTWLEYRIAPPHSLIQQQRIL